MRDRELSLARIGSSARLVEGGVMWQVFKSSTCVVTFAVTLAMAGSAGAIEKSRPSASRTDKSPFMQIYRATLPPYGYVRFCHEFPRECIAGRMSDARVEATASRMAELDIVNRHVNHTIEPATDQEIYGEVERWVIPTKRGDCEDYALLKRHMLIARGWPVGTLLMTVVRDEKGEGHAVLTVRTSKGDYILDNKTDETRIWHETPYALVMRQSYIDPNVWLSLEPGEHRLDNTPLAGMREANP
ncbi:MAG: transglutaminase-like cysteine peptidase [Hyphomicrobiaceae bacterium]